MQIVNQFLDNLIYVSLNNRIELCTPNSLHKIVPSETSQKHRLNNLKARDDSQRLSTEFL